MSSDTSTPSDLNTKIADFIFKRDLLSDDSFAVAVSGGPDSLALANILIEFAVKNVKNLHVITVDHGLRSESAQEAIDVQEWVKSFKNDLIKHQILIWEGDKPEKALMENARKARYEMIAEYCQVHNIRNLYVAHHADDQAETFLFRLSKGSGLDGLASMNEIQKYNDAVNIIRPLLGTSKEQLIDYCRINKLPYINDPSNEKQEYMRPRLRAAREVLEGEGLTSERLTVTASRIRRARDALEVLSDEAYEEALVEADKKSVILDWAYLRTCPEEITLRVITHVIKNLSESSSNYGVRMEKIEELFFALWAMNDLSLFKRRTLGKCIFSFDAKALNLIIEKENP